MTDSGQSMVNYLKTKKLRKWSKNFGYTRTLLQIYDRFYCKYCLGYKNKFF